MTTITLLAVLVAVVAAVRSTWSPCGISMLSTITPLAERSRGRRYAVTAGWFVVGALGGGAALGALAALGAALVAAAGPGRTPVSAAAAGATLIAAGFDSGVLRPALPHHRRQVNERWLDRYRGWVYGVGFGAQIGVGVATFIMTAGVYLTIVLAALTGRPVVALAVGLTFGLVRGAAVLLGVGLTSPQALARFHERFESLRQPVVALVLGVEVAASVVAGVTGGAATAAAVVAVVVAGVLTLRLRRVEPPAVRAAQRSVPAGPGSTAAAR